MNVLGIAGGFGHDAAACLVRDGQAIAMVEEERLVRMRHARGMLPLNAVIWCLAAGRMDLGEVDVLAVSWSPELERSLPRLQASVEDLLGHEAWGGSRPRRVVFVEHHVAHAASAVHGAGWDDAAILVIDGNGERSATSMGRARGGKIDLDLHLPPSSSLGHFYKTASEWAGLGSDGEGKLMGLAALGRAERTIDAIRLEPNGFAVDLPGYRDPGDAGRWTALRAAWRQWLESSFGPPNSGTWAWDPGRGAARRTLPLPPRVVAAAASVQTALMDSVVHLARVAVARAGVRRLALAGGVALNCAANGAILRSGAVDALWVPPVANDAGGALGAAWWVAAEGGDRPRPLATPLLGPAFTADAIRATLAYAGVAREEPGDLIGDVAAAVAEGACVGWFQGRAEIGPRALGARSIIARPDRVKLRDRVNELKGRESWRPLSPSIMAGFHIPLHEGTGSPFMLAACQATAEGRARLAGVVHVDGSMRVQSVTDDGNSWAALLREVGRRTGTPVLLNTSFNIGGEPIVGSVMDALRTFFASDLDALAIGPFLLRKGGSK